MPRVKFFIFWMTTKIDREKREIGTYGSHHNQSYSQQPEKKKKKKKENPIINKFYFNTYFSEKVFEKEY